ncbi:unnamed protein product, partial [Polarella glacialis]
HDFNPFHSLAHNPERVSVTLDAYQRQVADAGYRPPACPAADPETTLLALVSDGGALAAVRAAHEETWLDKLKRRNGEQTHARVQLKGV